MEIISYYILIILLFNGSSEGLCMDRSRGTKEQMWRIAQSNPKIT